MPAFYRNTLAGFMDDSDAKVISALHSGLAAQHMETFTGQHGAWQLLLPALRAAVDQLRPSNPKLGQWGLLLEYLIPGREKRIDAVMLTSSGIIAIEFKHTALHSADRWQLMEYCWNLRDFHCESRGLPLSPILTGASDGPFKEIASLRPEDDSGTIYTLQETSYDNLSAAINLAHVAMTAQRKRIPSLEQWDSSQIEPSKNIVSAALSIFSGHDVRAIHHAHSDSTDDAVAAVCSCVAEAKRKAERYICFVTGVPGAGKTLVGLRLAHSELLSAELESSVCFATGNNPLREVLIRALELDRVAKGAKRREARHAASTLFWNVHRFASAHIVDVERRPPPFRVVVFDEAQRVWTREAVKAAQEKRKQRQGGRPDLPEQFWDYSEPELLLEVMERWHDWCVVVALVGGGQEIHTGEAGLGEWGKALAKRGDRWRIWASPEAVHGGSSVAGTTLISENDKIAAEIRLDKALHLRISKRTSRAERLAEWVNHVIGGRGEEASALAPALKEFGLFLTRDIGQAKKELRRYAEEDRRYGLIASSEAKRLRAYGIEVSKSFRDGIDYPDWFVRPHGFLVSSNQLEVAATEFESQGLELDWTCICWGSDLLFDKNAQRWAFYKVWGQGLRPESDEAKHWFALNTYRVILTRAREGMIIFVPYGDPEDRTRPVEPFDATTEFLLNCGVSMLR